jgi:uncharacterized membrane protein YtjA (UPF0391 family)
MADKLNVTAAPACTPAGAGTGSGVARFPCIGRDGAPPRQKETDMLGWALTFLVIALIAAALGFGGIAGASAGIAQILFFVFIVLFVIAMIARAVRGQPPV